VVVMSGPNSRVELTVGAAEPATTIVPSFCRTCQNGCAVLVEITDGVAVRLIGDRENPVYLGYTCPKGRAQPGRARAPERILTPLRRTPDGGHESVSSKEAIDEIAGRLTAILREHGPEAIAVYRGTSTNSSTPAGHVAQAFLKGIGSDLFFTTNTIDKGGRNVAQAMFGTWMAPRQGWDRPDVALLIGLNPLVSYQGFPFGAPSKWLKAQQDRGMQLIVIDPRVTDVARRADLHLQPRPGTDAVLLAAMIHVILEEARQDRSFVADHVAGLEDLRRAVAPFTTEFAAGIADVPAELLLSAARTFSKADRGFAVGGTGPQMTTHGVLVEYLILSLEALCGHFLRSGEVVTNAAATLPVPAPKAQVAPPRQAYGFGRQFVLAGLRESVAGPPTAALPDEIIAEGPNKVRAVISLSGNPVAAIPGKRKAVEAFKELGLLVQIDPWMSETAQIADYVIPPTMWLEVPGLTNPQDFSTTMAPGYGLAVSHAQYSAAVSELPPNSDLMEEWVVFYRIAKAMGVQLTLAGNMWQVSEPVDIDMEVEPSTDEVIEMMIQSSRVGLDEIKLHPHGAIFSDPPVVVAPADDGWSGRFDLSNREMLSALARFADAQDGVDSGRFPFRLIPRRVQHVHNSTLNVAATNGGTPYNPAYIHPEDLQALEVEPGGLVEIYSDDGAIVGVAEPDDGLRRGLVSMTHCYGQLEVEDERADPRARGSSTNWLLSNDRRFDRFTGQPLMSNVPVGVRRWSGERGGNE
jgi:anaerobic selenocysteine-containing dehydrogenase